MSEELEFRDPPPSALKRNVFEVQLVRRDGEEPRSLTLHRGAVRGLRQCRDGQVLLLLWAHPLLVKIHGSYEEWKRKLWTAPQHYPDRLEMAAPALYNAAKYAREVFRGVLIGGNCFIEPELAAKAATMLADACRLVDQAPAESTEEIASEPEPAGEGAA